MTAIILLMNVLLQAGVSDPNEFNAYMILGYAVMWVIAIVYILTLANRQRNTREEVELLQQLLKENEEPADK